MADARQRLLIEIAVKNQQALGNVNNSLKKIERNSLTMGKAVKGALGAFAIIGGARLIGGLVNTVRTFEDLRATLVTIEGDAQKAGEAFDLIRKFTAGTTFQLEEVSNAFITFRNAGLNPTQAMMTDIGNIAAGMGKRIDDVARAVFNATTGEFEMLKQLGIKVKTEGKNLTVNFRGTARTIKNDGKEIVAFLREIGEVEFAGAIDARAKTLSGAFSNLQDQIAEVAVAIGEGGLKTELTEGAREMTKLLKNTPEVTRALGKMGELIGKTLNVLLKSFVGLLIGIGKAYDFIAGKVNVFLGNTDEAIVQQRKFNETYKTYFNDMNAMLPVQKKINDATAQGTKVNKTYEMKMGEMNQTVEEATEAQKKYTKATEDAQKETAAIAARFAHNVTLLDLTIDGFNQVNSTAVDALTDIVMGAQTLQEALGTIAKVALRQLIAGFIQLAIVTPILNKLAEMLGFDMVSATQKQTNAEKELNRELQKQIGLRLLLRLVGGFANGGAVGYANGGAIGFGGARAGGGAVGGSNAFLVGERGPELFIPNTAGTIVSNETMGSRMGETNINFNINAIDAQGFDELLLSRKNLIVGTIQKAFRQQGRRLA